MARIEGLALALVIVAAPSACALIEDEAEPAPYETWAPGTGSAGWVWLTPPVDLRHVSVFDKVVLGIVGGSEDSAREMMTSLSHDRSERTRELAEALLAEPSPPRQLLLIAESYVEREAPLSRWEEVGAFNSAAECSEARIRSLAYADELVAAILEGLVADTYNPAYMFDTALGYTLAASSRCIPTSELYGTS